MKLSAYAKTIVAVGAGLASAVSVTADGEFSLNDGFVIASAAVGALLVWAIPNTPEEG